MFIDGWTGLTVNLTNVAIAWNVAWLEGGGLFARPEEGATIILGGTTQVHHNIVVVEGSKGGGLYLGAGTLEVVGNDVTITENVASSGGGIYFVTGTSYTGWANVYNNSDDDIAVGPEPLLPRSFPVCKPVARWRFICETYPLDDWACLLLRRRGRCGTASGSARARRD